MGSSGLRKYECRYDKYFYSHEGLCKINIHPKLRIGLKGSIKSLNKNVWIYVYCTKGETIILLHHMSIQLFKRVKYYYFNQIYYAALESRRKSVNKNLKIKMGIWIAVWIPTMLCLMDELSCDLPPTFFLRIYYEKKPSKYNTFNAYYRYIMKSSSLSC